MDTSRRSRLISWGLLALALLGSAAGSLLNLYGKFWWYDEALHFYFIFALTLLVGLYASGVVLTGAHDHGLLLILTIASIGLACGTVFEIYEWVYDEMVRPNAIRGKTDTIIDLIVGAVGALAAGYVSVRMLKT